MATGGVLPAAALVFNAFTWGVSWWPLRQLQLLGLHPLWSTALVYGLAVGAILLARPRALAHLVRTPRLWWLVLASGCTNAAFNWGVTVGDVVRVVLLFYLMPLWAVLLARWLLHEPLTHRAALRVALALAGAAIVLWPAAGTVGPVWHPADVLGVAGGFSFALNNVLLRREAREPEEARALAMFAGGAVVAAAVAAWLTSTGRATAPPELAWGWALAALGLGAWFLLANLSLQYGASRLRANVTAVVMVTEVVFASVSALALGAGTLTLGLAVGATLIIAAAVLAAWD